MVREGRVLISSATDPDFGSDYYITAYEVGAQVTSIVTNSTSVTVKAGHGFAALDKFIVASDFPATTRFRTVSSVGATTLTLSSTVTLAAGDILVNLGQDTGSTSPNFVDSRGAGFPTAIYTDMDYTTLATFSTVIADSTGRYRYFYSIIPRWELIQSSSGVPVALVMDTGDAGVGGAASSTDNAVVRWDGTAGQTLQNSVVIIADSTGNMSGVGTLAVGGALTAAAAVTVGTTLGVTGTSTLAAVNASGTIAAAGAVTVGTTLGVTGAVTASAAVSVGTTLGVSGAATLNSTLTVGGNATVSGNLIRSVAAAVTAAASPNNTQAGGTALTKDINNIATCAAAGNSVVMPAAAPGLMISIFNNGAQSCAIWPAVGDSITGVVNVQNTLTATSNVTYVAFDTTNWEII